MGFCFNSFSINNYVPFQPSYGCCCGPRFYNPMPMGYMPFGYGFCAPTITSVAGFGLGWTLSDMIFGRK